MTWHKGRLIAKGRRQKLEIDYVETFSLVVKITIMFLLLTITTTNKWDMLQLDVSNVFIDENLSETVHMKKPMGFQNSTHLNYICMLKKGIYRLMQSTWHWFSIFTSHLNQIGFSERKAYPS